MRSSGSWWRTPQNRGIGTVLLKHLLGLAHTQGVAQIVAEVLPQNTRMLELVAGSGVPVRQTLDEGVIQLVLQRGSAARFKNPSRCHGGGCAPHHSRSTGANSS